MEDFVKREECLISLLLDDKADIAIPSVLATPEQMECLILLYLFPPLITISVQNVGFRTVGAVREQVLSCNV